MFDNEKLGKRNGRGGECELSSGKRGVGEAFGDFRTAENTSQLCGKGFSALPDCPYGGAGRTISRHETCFSARRKSPFGSTGKAITNSRKV